MNNATKQTADAKILQRTLDAHGVKAIHARTFTGPTVTQHAFDLTAGTPLKKVTNLHQDLALALGLDSVRIIAPIPGTAWVGIEVPNEDREDVTYADFVHDAADVVGETGDQIQQTGILPIPVGVTITSEALWADLTKLPHLLIAGTTGSGKSVALTSSIAHLIATKTPAELRLWLVDPKRVELQQFADAPQVEQVATSPADALDLLDEIVSIMDERYKLFGETGVRNIGEYNADSSGLAAARLALPYHVVVVDELADLMMTGNKRIEEQIVRLAQLARAAGIHLILATQRPTRDVVTGLISANITSRWCFRVGSHIDSNVALGQSGAEALYGHGDSLWSPAGSLKPVRVQGVYTADETVESIVTNAVHEHTAEPLPSAAADDDDEFDEELPLVDEPEIPVGQALVNGLWVDGRYVEGSGHLEPQSGYIIAEPLALQNAVIAEPLTIHEANGPGEINVDELVLARIAELLAEREDRAPRRPRFGWLKSKWVVIPAAALGGSWTIGACLQLLGYGS